MKLHEALEQGNHGDTDETMVYNSEFGIQLMYHGPDCSMTVFPKCEWWTPLYKHLVSDNWEVC